MDQLATYDQAAVMEDQPRFAMDKRLYVNFYVKALMNNFKSAEAGRPIFDEVDFIRIIVPGDKNTIIDTKASPEYRARFREKYDAFKKGQTMAQTGTPLEVWPQMTVGMVAELKAMHVSTVEQLAELPDTLAQRIMGNFDLRRKAQVFLDSAAGDAVASKLQAELATRDNEIDLLKAQMIQLMEKMSAPVNATTAKKA
jgi:hypothetical protein